MDDRKIIGLFEARSEQAIGALAEKCGNLCLHIATNILASREDALECVNDAYLALWNNIPPDKPIFLRAYLLKVVRNIAYDRLQWRSAARRDDTVTVCLHELADCLPSGDDLDAILESQIIRSVLNDYLYSLKERDRSMFIRRYFCMESCRTIGKDLFMTESAVSTRLLRLRQKLKDKLMEEGIEL